MPVLLIKQVNLDNWSDDIVAACEVPEGTNPLELEEEYLNTDYKALLPKEKARIRRKREFAKFFHKWLCEKKGYKSVELKGHVVG